MRTQLSLSTASFLFITSFMLSHVDIASAQVNIESRAKEFVGLLAKKKFAAARKYLDSKMDSLVSDDNLRAAWDALTAQAGAFQSQGATRKETLGGFDIIYVTCQFEKSPLDVKVAFDKERKIAGFFFVPTQAAATATEKPASVEEREVTVGSGKWALPGTLSVPKGKGPFPAVVLVHGSGPNDRDETIGPNKPLRDLAWGLASKGIAVLRYEKRTREHATELASIADSLTVREETVDDAVSGAELLRHTPGIDPGKVYVLGHSLGGMLVPRIGASDTNIAGFVIMAGPTRPLEDMMIEQVSYIVSLKDSVTDDERMALEQFRIEAAKVKSVDSAGSPTSARPFGIPASYWLDLRDYNPPEAAKSLHRPMLILQGDRDYQVTKVDLRNWQNALAGRSDVTFKTYPGLNHLFIEGTGKSSPDDYQKPGHVAQAAIDDIAAWIVR